MRTRRDRDEELLEALRKREPTAVERLVATYGDRAYRLATRITGNGQDGKEVVQDAFLATVRKIDSFRQQCAFGSWLYRIVANAAYQKLRSRQTRRRHLSCDEVLPAFDEQSGHVLPMRDWSPRVNDPSIQRELRVALTTAINELPAAYRTVLILRDVEGLSNLEIAELLGEKLLDFLRVAKEEAPFAGEVPSFLAEIREIFDRDEIRTYLDNVQRVGVLGHVATDDDYEEMHEAGAIDEDPVW